MLRSFASREFPLFMSTYLDRIVRPLITSLKLATVNTSIFSGLFVDH